MMSKAQAVTLKLSLMSRDCLAPWMTAKQRALPLAARGMDGIKAL